MRRLLIAMTLVCATASVMRANSDRPANRDCTQEQFQEACNDDTQAWFDFCRNLICNNCFTWNYTPGYCHYDENNCFTYAEYGYCTCGQCHV